MKAEYRKQLFSLLEFLNHGEELAFVSKTELHKPVVLPAPMQALIIDFLKKTQQEEMEKVYTEVLLYGEYHTEQEEGE